MVKSDWSHEQDPHGAWRDDDIARIHYAQQLAWTKNEGAVWTLTDADIREVFNGIDKGGDETVSVSPPPPKLVSFVGLSIAGVFRDYL